VSAGAPDCLDRELQRLIASDPGPPSMPPPDPGDAGIDEASMNGERPRLEADEQKDTATPETPPVTALASAQVDLIDRIQAGIPEREVVSGGAPWLLKGKRYLLPAPAGTGKSLLAVITAAEIVDGGGTVAILDVENGADEYARRFEDVLQERGGVDGKLALACRERLRYYAWPQLRMTWGDEEWAAAFSGVDLVVFDSSRLLLSAAGLAEDSNDDYSTFVNALLVPLARAGVTTIVLDNTGHEGERARGASAKSDLNEVVYVVETGEPFDREHTGNLRLVRKRTRFAELPPELRVVVGGGAYGPIEAVEPAPDADGFRPTTLMERISEAVEQEPGMSKSKVRKAVSGNNHGKDVALELLVDEGYLRAEQKGQAQRHYSARLYRQSEDPKADSDA